MSIQKEKIKKIIVEIKESPDSFHLLKDDMHIINEIGLDSLQMINFLLKLEEEFDIEIDYDSFDIEEMSSIDRLSIFLSKQKKADKTDW